MLDKSSANIERPADAVLREMVQSFRHRFRTEPVLFRAPGRVNLIGEHTDYNEGFVLPAAIQFSTWALAAPRADRAFAAYSENMGSLALANLDDLESAKAGSWSDYPFGVASALERVGLRLKGCNLYLKGEVPLGAGLSSSASLEVSVAMALLGISGHGLDKRELALLCQRAENQYVGMRCGIMDQYVSCFAEQNHALLLDCRSLQCEQIPLPPVRLVICNTMVKHELTGSAYNDRRSQCEEGVQVLSRIFPGVHALRDVSLQQLEASRTEVTEIVFKRCKHIITENTRVLRTVTALKRGEYGQLDQLMAESHRSMRDDFEISCEELDVMVEAASKQQGVMGARMTGGGFGGCTVNLVASEHVEAFCENVGSIYRERTGIVPEIHVCSASDGAEAVNGPGGADR